MLRNMLRLSKLSNFEAEPQSEVGLSWAVVDREGTGATRQAAGCRGGEENRADQERGAGGFQSSAFSLLRFQLSGRHLGRERGLG